MIELVKVSYRYPGYRQPAIHDIDLRLGAGEVVGLVGPNDAGKSTLGLVAAGLAPASIGGELAGDVRIDGASVIGRRPHDLASSVGIVFSNPAAHLSGVASTVFEEIAFGPVNLGCSAGESRTRAREAMELLGIAGLAEREPSRLSGGQAQLVAIASMVAMRQRHLVLDEPVAELDPEGRQLVSEALRSLARAGTGLLIAEHDTDLLDALCDRIVAIEDGRLAPAAASAQR
ncbi:MAG TPA: ABC transporter ATP-binding protein [Candidatus Limnocylindria bacterium]|nr:ABC transporter ATP-binding protein [Candidatus Limnocylindria bacterium]